MEYSKQTDNLRVSIVTICFNTMNSIEKTILSVINQTYQNIEYIIIDGGSTDGTVDVIRKYADKIAYWVSEPDKGIYDAMNKGIKVATGGWINFMNAGDRFHSAEVVSSLFSTKTISENPDVIYGYQIHLFSYGAYVRKYIPLHNFLKFMPIGHSSSFVKSQLLKEREFDCRYKVAADYNFFYQLYKEHKRFIFVEELVAEFESESGVSNSSLFVTMKETAMINGEYGSMQYFAKMLYVFCNNFLKKVIFGISPDIAQTIRKKRKYTVSSEYISLEDFKRNKDRCLQ